MNIIKKRLCRILTAADNPDWEKLLSDLFDANIDDLDDNTWNKLKEIAERDHNESQPLITETEYQLIKNTSLDSFKNSLKKDFISTGLELIKDSKEAQDKIGYVSKNQKYYFIKIYDLDFFGGWLSNSKNKLLEIDFPADDRLNYLDTLDANLMYDIIYPRVGHDYSGDSATYENFWNAYDKYFNVH